MTIGRVFGAFEVLGVADRFELGQLLARPHDLLAISSDEVAARSLPSERAVRAQFLVRLQRVLERVVDAEMSSWRLDRVVPLIADLSAVVESSPVVTNRLVAVVGGQGRRCWDELATATVGEVRGWNGAGVKLTAQLITAGVDASMRKIEAQRTDEAATVEWPKEPEVVAGDEATVLFASAQPVGDNRPERARRSSNLNGVATLFEGFGAPPIGQPDHRMTGRPNGLRIETSGGRALPARSGLTGTLDTCLAAISDRRQRIAFELNDLRLDDPFGSPAARSQMTAELVGVGAEHIRKLRQFARLRARETLESDAELAATVATLAEQLGSLADRASFDRALAAANLPSTADPAGLLAVYLAGPYRPVPDHLGWWAIDPAEVVEATRRLIRDSGGVHDRSALTADLEGEGISPVVVDAWLDTQTVRTEGELVVSLTGRTTDVAARVLEATGRAMTGHELAAWMPTTDLASRLIADLGRHSAFVQTSPDCWELAEWGGEPSTHLIRWRVPVTASTIDGDEGDAPSEMAAVMGLRAGRTVRLATRYGPIALAYDGQRVVRGSARPVLLAAGAGIGDTLILVVDITGQAVGVELERRSEIAD